MTRKQKRNIEKRRNNRFQQKPKKLIMRRRLRELVKEINYG